MHCQIQRIEPPNNCDSCLNHEFCHAEDWTWRKHSEPWSSHTHCQIQRNWTSFPLQYRFRPTTKWTSSQSANRKRLYYSVKLPWIGGEGYRYDKQYCTLIRFDLKFQAIYQCDINFIVFKERQWMNKMSLEGANCRLCLEVIRLTHAWCFDPYTTVLRSFGVNIGPLQRGFF